MAGFYFFGLVLLSVFGPTFIDRSISYHIAFYAADNGVVEIEKIEEVFVNEIFEKRIHDATVSGILTDEGNGLYKPTAKAHFISNMLKPLGKITGSLGTYDEMVKKLKEEVKNENLD